MPFSSPLDRPSENAKTVDRLMPMTFGLRSSMTVFRICHCSSPHSSACCPRPTSPAAARADRLRFEHAALRRPAERDAFDARDGRRRSRGRTLVEEDVDRAAPGRKRLGSRDGGEDGVLAVLAHRDDPEIDAMLAHQRRQERVETLLQPLLLHRRLLAQRAEWTRLVRRLRHQERRRHPGCGNEGNGTQNTHHRDLPGEVYWRMGDGRGAMGMGEG